MSYDYLGLRAYAVVRDRFALAQDHNFNAALAFPCCVCAYNHYRDDVEPCRVCDHNVNAVNSDPVREFTEGAEFMGPQSGVGLVEREDVEE